ncbi:MAG: sigma-70 family RNA polymerase sigma factor [Oscillospiraceae bacterium]|nr:sigma-70 family RNA polymerase sigma factor [Oscillospiraceae bacterium]
MNDYVVIEYNGEQVSVPKEVADFLEQDQKREQAQKKQDSRHLSKSEFETVLSGSDCVRRPVEDAVLRNLRLENLRKAIANLDDKDQAMISLRYSGELTMEEIGKVYDISKMAVSKRLKKLHEKLGRSVL